MEVRYVIDVLLQIVAVYVLALVRALMTGKSCAVGMRNAILNWGFPVGP